MVKMLALALLAVACGNAAQYAPNATWLQPSDAGYDEQVQWGMPLPSNFRVLEVPADEMTARCGSTQVQHGRIAGCASSGTITLRNDLAGARHHAVLLHEMGHVLGATHIQDPVACPEDAAGLFVMCAVADLTIAELALEDYTML